MKNSMVKTIIEYKYIFQFDKLFDLMSEEWEMKNDKNQACILDEFTKQGNKFAEIYKSNCDRSFLNEFCISYILGYFLHINYLK